MIKRYNYRLYPSPEQGSYFQQIFGSCRWVYNWALDKRIESYKQSKERGDEKPKGLSIYDISKELTQLKKTEEFKWLNETPSVCHNWSLQHLEAAFKNFFKRAQKDTGYPQFKSKHRSKKSFSYHQGYKMQHGYITAPKTKGWVKFTQHRPMPEVTKTITISQEPSGKYYVSIVTDDMKPVPVMRAMDESKVLGVDVGVVNTITFSNDKQFCLDMRYVREWELQLRSQKKLSRKVKGSNNFRKQKIRNAKKHEVIRFKRENDINNIVHEAVTYLLDEGYCGISIRKYDIKSMTNKNSKENKAKPARFRRRLNKRLLADGAMGMLQMKLKQKCAENGLHVIEFDASDTKTTERCFMCNSTEVDIDLKKREMECRKCGHVADIDKNASKNVKAYTVENQDWQGFQRIVM